MNHCALSSPVLSVQDNNMGLVRQVAASIHKRSIQRLTQTYLTLSLTDLAAAVKLPSAEAAEKYLVTMVGAER